MNPYDVLAQRAVGELPLSIGTSLALEALAENTKYGSLWINLRTLYRNIYDSVENVRRPFLTAKSISETLQEELNYIRQYAEGKIDHVQLYHREYGDLLRRFPKAKLLVPNTPLQKQYSSLMHQTIDYVLGNDIDQTIEWDKGSILQGEPTKALIITHYPVDLLSRTKFIQLRLLESYTGAIKSKSQWNSKLTEGKYFKKMPFNEFTIQIFGDGPVLMRRWGIEYRRALIALAEKYRWTSMTTMEKVRQNLKWMEDKNLARDLAEAL